MRVVVVLFTRDLRVHDHPALAAAVREADAVVPLFVFDRAILAGDFACPNRMEFLLGALTDLRDSLRGVGGDLAVRRGDPVAETIRVARAVGASAVFMSDDVSAYAQARTRCLADACASARVLMRTFPGVTVIAPGDVRPAGGDHYRVFTPYWRQWRAAPWRAVHGRP